MTYNDEANHKLDCMVHVDLHVYTIYSSSQTLGCTTKQSSVFSPAKMYSTAQSVPTQLQYQNLPWACPEERLVG